MKTNLEKLKEDVKAKEAEKQDLLMRLKQKSQDKDNLIQKLLNERIEQGNPFIFDRKDISDFFNNNNS